MQFKKIFLASSVLISAAIWAPQAQAIPAFARQVGMACTACHQQHFPALNSFGRQFKENGYTLIGAQEKIEEPKMLSLPVVLNGALVGYMQYQKTSGSTTAVLPTPLTPTSKSTNDGQTQIPQQVSLFLAGRVGEHAGFESEINLAGAGTETAGSTGVGLIRIKVPMVYEVGGVNSGIIPFSTQGLGVADSFEVLNTGAVAVHSFNQTGVAGATTGGMQVISAQQFIGTATPAYGMAFIASNDNFFANFAKWGVNQGSGAGGGPTSNYLRAAWTPGIHGFDTAFGVQIWKGDSATDQAVSGGTLTSAGYVPGVYDTDARAIDAQLLGEVGGIPLTVVASYATAPVSTTGGDLGNYFNQGTQTRKSFNVGAELGVIPNKATVQLGLRVAKAGVAVPGGAANSNASDNAIMLAATYALAYNMRLELTLVKASGDMYNGQPGSQTDPTTNTSLGDKMATVDLAFGF